MNIADYLKPSAVVINDEISSKKRTLEEISRLLTQNAEYVAEKDVFTSLINREKLGSTGLGSGVAIPHGRLRGVEHSVGAFIRLAKPIDYDAADGAPVDLVFGLLVPQDATSQHLEILASIARMFQDEAQLARLREAEDDASLYQLLTQYRPG